MTLQFNRLLSVCLFLTFVIQTEAFTASSHERWHSAAKLSHSRLPAYHASSPLQYMDRDASEAQPNVQTTTSPSDTEQSGVSMTLIRAIWLNQSAMCLFATAVVGFATFISGGLPALSSLHWNGVGDFHSLFDWNLNELRLLEGFLAALPIVALGSLVENSDRRDASHVNFSTTNMVISLFGRRKSICDPQATSSATTMMLAAAIALSTGISEEMVFRGYIPTGIESLSHSVPIALMSQAALFALAHISPQSSSGENKVVGGLQFLNGLWYGLVYTMTGGDIVPCIIAHTLYDMHVLCETWSVINHQMDYTQDAFPQRLDSTEEDAISRIQEQAGPALNTETLNFARRFFYAFDYEHKGSLSLSDVQRAVNYAFLKDEVVPAPEQVEDVFGRVLDTRDVSMDYPGDRLVVPEFLRVLFTLKSRGAITL